MYNLIYLIQVHGFPPSILIDIFTEGWPNLSQATDLHPRLIHLPALGLRRRRMKSDLQKIISLKIGDEKKERMLFQKSKKVD
jgi:hypothetical protein